MLRLNIQSGPDFSSHSNILGVIRYGDSPGFMSARQQIPQLLVKSRTRDEQPSCLVLTSDKPVSYGNTDGYQHACDGQMLFATTTCAAAATESTSHGGQALEGVVCSTYRQGFGLMRQLGFPNLWRTWNYLSDINLETGGMERYRQFNVGRHEAFAENLSIAHGSMPAACALGTATQGLAMAILASNSGFEQIENPRQSSAYEYPAQYGPRSPTFSRAILARMNDRSHLFISGTASIVGHVSVHADDVIAQTSEALNNIKAILAEANSRQTHTRYALQNLKCVVYVRHAQDFSVVDSVIKSQIHAAANAIVYVQADICRKELLVEIEAFCFDH